MPINYFSNKLDAILTDLKSEFPQVFFEGLSCCTKTEVRFEIKVKLY